VPHHHGDRESLILSHGTPHGANRRTSPIRPLPTTTSAKGRRSSTGKPKRTAVRGSREARTRAHHDCERGTTAAPLHRRRPTMPSPPSNKKVADLKAQIEAHRELSTSLAFDRTSVARLGGRRTSHPVADIVQCGPAPHKCLRELDLGDRPMAIDLTELAPQPGFEQRPLPYGDPEFHLAR
jgi:hypothetical protein